MRDCVRFPAGRRVEGNPERRSDDDGSRLAAPVRTQDRHQGRLRRRRLRRLHRRGRRAWTATACRYRGRQRLHPLRADADGWQVVTVEDLKAPDGALHPVQQAMVDCHGSQCGFCTPGFVMSMFAAVPATSPNPTPTGSTTRSPATCAAAPATRPISAAGSAHARTRRPGERPLRRRAGRHRRAAEGPEGRRNPRASVKATACSTPRHPRRASPTLLAENPEARIVAGATDVGLWVTKLHACPRYRHLYRARPGLPRHQRHGRRAGDRAAGRHTPMPGRRAGRRYTPTSAS